MLRVSEMFGPTIQGEGLVIGQPTYFVRLGGCDYRCVWCDTLYAVLPEYRPTWSQWEPEAIVEHIRIMTGEVKMLVTISGGNPALFKLDKLIDELHLYGYTCVVETQGSVCPDWLHKLDQLCVSPKPPSSKMDTDWAVLEKVVNANPNSYLKVVVFDDKDYEYAHRVHKQFPHTPFVLQAGTPAADAEADQYLHEHTMQSLESLIDKFTKDLGRWSKTTRVLPQLHSLVWGRKRGV